MTRRLFWLAMGVTIGVLVMRKLSAAAARLTPTGIAGSIAAGLSELAESLGDFAGEVRQAMSEREAELRSTSGLVGGSVSSASSAKHAG